MTANAPSSRLARWLIRLEPFIFVIVYRKGKLHQAADEMSRICINDEADDAEDAEDDMGTFINCITLSNDDFRFDQDDEELKVVIDAIENDTTPAEVLTETQRILLRDRDKLRVIDHKLFFEDTDSDGTPSLRYVVARKQVDKIIAEVHSTTFAGHLGYDKTLEKARTRFYWPFSASSIKKFIKECRLCQMNKSWSKPLARASS